MSRQAIRAAISLDAETMDVGERSPKIVCPFCNGGGGGEVSFTYTKAINGILYGCFRASCSVRGFIPYSGVVQTEHRPFKKPTLRQFASDLTPLPRNYVTFLDRKFGITGGTLRKGGVKWSPEKQGVWYPIRDYRGYDLGGVIRFYPPEDFHEFDLMGGHEFKGPKSLTYKHSGALPFVGFFPADNPLHVIVEDNASALKVQQAGISSICLVGTHLSTEAALYVAEHVSEVAISLDLDATRKAVEMQREVAILFSSCRQVPLRQDLKYESEEQIRSMYL